MHVYSCQQGMYQTGIKRLRTSFLGALERILKMRIPKGFFIDVTHIPLEDRLKFFPQFANNCCRKYLTNVKWCLAVNRTGTVETYSTTVEGDGWISRYKSALTREGCREMYFTDLGGL